MKKYNSIDLGKIKEEYEISGDVYWVDDNTGEYDILNDYANLDHLDTSNMPIGMRTPFQMERVGAWDILDGAVEATSDDELELTKILEKWIRRKGFTQVSVYYAIDLDDYKYKENEDE